MFQNFKSTARLLWIVLFLLPLSIKAQNQLTDTIKSIDLQQVTITATMATDKTPMTFVNIRKDELRKNDFGQDVPYLLKSTPSVVETSDAGAGVGYTGIRIRGSDPTRINITVDGVPINDSESQSVYWVNMPDLTSSTSMIQIQRGVGTSTNGAGAFGATINMVSNGLNPEKYINLTGGFGSFNTQKLSISAGTGLIKNKFAVDMRLSQIKSDGYVDRAASDLQSLYLSGLYLGKKSSLKFKFFTGKEKTYQSWYGIPESYLTDSKLRTYNPAGTDKSPDPYANQTDNYRQTHSHLAWNKQINADWSANITGHYTHGEGYYEEYKGNEKLNKYFTDFPSKKKDLIRQLWLKNDFYGSLFSTNYKKNKVDLTIGGAWNNYSGDHFGLVTWIDSANLLKAPKEFYRSAALKNDFQAFTKINYDATNALSLFADMQFRKIGYSYNGKDRKIGAINGDFDFNFFNPKVGLNYVFTEGVNFYSSFAVANREPNRNDFTESPSSQIPQSENLKNVETGIKTKFDKVQFGANFYGMFYKNQLVVTGQINDVGEAIRINVPKSYRMGIELEVLAQLSEKVSFNANAAFSQNKIKNFTEKIDNWDTGSQDIFNRGTTDLALSPNTILNGTVAYDVLKEKLGVALSGKYVGKQFIDNTSNENTMLRGYSFWDAKIYYTGSFRFIKKFTAKLLINNILDKKFVNNAWTYRFNSASYDPRPDDPYARNETGSTYNLTGYFPQAGRNLMLAVSLDF